MPKISVVIPSFNHAQFLPDAVNSVLQQTEHDMELIVVDDGSRDNSLEVLSRFKDPRLKVFPQDNQGAHAAINRGLSLACGEYLAVLNSDDVYHTQRIENLVAILEHDPNVGLASSYIEVIDSNSKVLGIKHGYQDLEPWQLDHPEYSFRNDDDLRSALLTENYLSTTSNLVFTRSVFEKVGSFRKLRYAHDWDFIQRLSMHAQLALVPEALLCYRIHSTNTIRENKDAMIFEICWCLAANLPSQVASEWFQNKNVADRTKRLLYSIYTFGMDPVLVGMLLEGVGSDLTKALKLLEPGSPERACYLAYIHERSEELSAKPPVSSPLTIVSQKTFHDIYNWIKQNLR